MKKLQFLIIFLALTAISYAGNGLTEESANSNSNSNSSAASIDKSVINEDIVINHAMIEKFNNAEYSSGQLSFASLMSKYNFQEIKEISQAYQNGEIEVLTEASIQEFANSKKSDEKWLHLYSEEELNTQGE